MKHCLVVDDSAVIRKVARRSNATRNVRDARSSARWRPARLARYRCTAAKCRSKIASNASGISTERAIATPSPMASDPVCTVTTDILSAAGLKVPKLAASLSDTPGIGHPVVGCFVHNRLVGVARYEVLTDPAEAEIALVWTSARGRLA